MRDLRENASLTGPSVLAISDFEVRSVLAISAGDKRWREHPIFHEFLELHLWTSCFLAWNTGKIRGIPELLGM